jgi:hypothetical protein
MKTTEVPIIGGSIKYQSLEVKDLRIGNWLITYATALPQYFRVTSWHIKYLDENGFRDEAPVPLTPEILKACGFENPTNEFLNNYFFKDFNIYYSKEYCEWTIDDRGDNEGSKPRLIQYLHQLQNIYFALTNNELEITL